MKRTIILVAALTIVGGGLGLAVATGDTGAGGASADAPATDTALVERRTLTEEDEVEGVLGYGDPSSITNRGAGTLTKVPGLGTVIERNGVIYEIDGREVRLLYGDSPAFRRLAADVDDGPDIEQLERNLKDLGFAKGLITRPDAAWSPSTTEAVKRWQRAAGADADGVVEDGEVIFMPGPVRVASHEADVGAPAQPGAPVLAVTGTTRRIDVDLDARKQRLAQQGAKVGIELPDGSTTTGTVTEVGTVATGAGSGDAQAQGQDDDATIEVTVALDDDTVGGSLDGAPVTVRFTSKSKEGVLAVPLVALLALAEGGYAVELADTGELLPVETGMFSGGFVEVTGEGLVEGAEVVVPRWR